MYQQMNFENRPTFEVMQSDGLLLVDQLHSQPIYRDKK